MNFTLIREKGLAPLLILFLSILLFFLGSYLNKYLIYDRNLIAEYELWRLITGNLLHTNINHLIMNLLALLLLFNLYIKNFSFLSYISLFIFCSLGVTIGIFFFAPSIIKYVGLSGVLHGIFVYGSYLDIKKGFRSSWFLFFAVWIKIIYEQVFGANESLSELINASVAIEAHLYGAISALIFCFIHELYLRYKISKTKR